MERIHSYTRKFFVAPLYIQALVHILATLVLLQYANNFFDKPVPGLVVVSQSLFIGALIAFSSAFRMRKTLKTEYWLAFQDALDSCAVPTDKNVRLVYKAYAEELIKQKKYCHYSTILLTVGAIFNVALYFASSQPYWAAFSVVYVIVSLICEYDSWYKLCKARSILDKMARSD